MTNHVGARARCESAGCMKPAGKGRRICEACKSKRWREKNPVAFIWHNLKNSARKRSLPFGITLDFLRELCDKNNMLANRGRAAESYSVNRIDNDAGYMDWNIEIITKSENTRKYHEHVRGTILEESTEEVPF